MDKTDGEFDKNKVIIKLMYKRDSVIYGGDRKISTLSYENKKLKKDFKNWAINFLDINGDRSDLKKQLGDITINELIRFLGLTNE